MFADFLDPIASLEKPFVTDSLTHKWFLKPPHLSFLFGLSVTPSDQTLPNVSRHVSTVLRHLSNVSRHLDPSARWAQISSGLIKVGALGLKKSFVHSKSPCSASGLSLITCSISRHPEMKNFWQKFFSPTHRLTNTEVSSSPLDVLMSQTFVKSFL